MPEAGSQPSQSEKTTMRTMPSQNTGMLAPKREVTAHSGGDAEGETAERRQQQAAARQDEGGLESVEHLVEDGAFHPERSPEIPAEDVAHPAEVLDVQRLRQAELAPETREIFLGRLGA